MQNKEIVTFETETGETIYVETTLNESQQHGYIKAGTQENEPQRMSKTLEGALGLITPIANGVSGAVQNMNEKPSEVVTTFKVAFSSKFDIKLVTLSGDSHLEIKLTWKGRDSDEI